ncbi:ABC transporter ATP-binding protein [Paenalcaligenes niemegkensis]|uniref:ABC transporter ATP-binding protein n=1 Tax=Paenalcaligenes niemegkensis TaxID=2895469 RepID=UPI001EE87036|nr:ABC transporter ATP-binding protein [Paenalcaligenes niemegkensis]MCQ9615381.1 ABC transporter ATP-binding protein [Paenalcaligenes niemegkensis]
MADEIILVEDAGIGYGAALVAQHINFRLHVGEVLCLLGPNGTGKSTLFKSLLGLIPLIEGRVCIQQRPLPQWTRRELAQTIAYVPQAAQGMFAFEAIEVVLMGRNAHISRFSAPSRADYEVASQCLDQLGVAHLAGRIYTQLSGGEQQLVLLARALAQQPKALILDEPTASLDFGNQIRVLEKVIALKDQGLGIFFCTHQPEHARRISDRVLLLKDGQLALSGATAEVLTSAVLAELYELPLQTVQHYLRNVID